VSRYSRFFAFKTLRFLHLEKVNTTGRRCVALL